MKQHDISYSQVITFVGVNTALENVFFIDEDNLLTDEEMYIANVQVMHIYGLPMYFFTGNPVEGTNVSDTFIEGYAFAFHSDNADFFDSVIDQMLGK